MPGAQLRVAGDADRLPLRGGDRPRARRVDRRRVPLPPRARPERRPSARARRRHAGRSSTTSAGSPSPCGRFGAGRVVTPDDVDGLTARHSRAGRRRDGAGRGTSRCGTGARELTWAGVRTGASRSSTGAAVIFRRDRFGDLIRRQLDLFVEDEAELLREAEEAERGVRHRRPQDCRGGVRGLSTRARGNRGRARRPA